MIPCVTRPEDEVLPSGVSASTLLLRRSLYQHAGSLLRRTGGESGEASEKK